MKKVKKEVENCGNCRIWGTCNKPESVGNNCDNWEPVKKVKKCDCIVGYTRVDDLGMANGTYLIYYREKYKPSVIFKWCPICGKKIKHGGGR